MIKNKHVKIGFFTLVKVNWKTKEEKNKIDNPLFEIENIISYVLKRNKKDKFPYWNGFAITTVRNNEINNLKFATHK